MSRRLFWLALAPVLLGTAAQAQADPHAGHKMEAAAAPAPAAPAVDPHAGHVMPMPGAKAAPEAAGASLAVGAAPAPLPPTDNLADAVWGQAEMERARAGLRAEHGGAPSRNVMLDKLEFSSGSGRDGYRWDGELRYGGDINRLVVRSEGGGERGERADQIEVEALWSRAVTRYFDLQVGVRQDFQPRPRRTYASVGFEGLAPYWFDVEGAVRLSDRGEAFADVEGSYDLRLTQRLILRPNLEATLSAQDVPELGVGAGLSDLTLGLRLRYEIRREFAPYIGVEHERRFGDTARYVRAAGDKAGDTRLVAGVRIWF